MARTKKHHRRGKGITFPIAVVAGFIPAAVDLWGKKDNPMALGNEASRIFLGWDYWDANFDLQRMKWGTLPIIIGLLVHKFVGGKLGINKMLARSGVPFIRL